MMTTGRSGQGHGVAVGMLRGVGDSLTWFRGFLVWGFRAFGFLVSWFIGLLVAWFLGFLVSKFLSFKDAEIPQCF